MTVVLQCENLSKAYDSGPATVEVLKNINFSVQEKSRVAIVGASGSGKSTLMHCLGGLDVPNAGSVQVCGKDMSALSDAQRGELRNQSLGFIYQFHHLLPEFTALENVAMPLLLRSDSIADAEANASTILAKVGLENRVLHKPTELSGGERQRVAIARALVTNPKVILADEPTGNLDRKNAMQVQAEMLELNKDLNTAIVIVTHDASIADSMDEIYTLEDGVLNQQ
ncbi:MAG: lipoprotein-releasing ABC transporter ATP-binding protein LolD [Pseudomonadota bacterium]